MLLDVPQVPWVKPWNSNGIPHFISLLFASLSRSHHLIVWHSCASVRQTSLSSEYDDGHSIFAPSHPKKDSVNGNNKHDELGSIALAQLKDSAPSTSILS